MDRPAYRTFAFSLSLLMAGACLAARIQEKFDDGKIKLDYTENAEGKKQGAYSEYYPSGRRKIQASYKADQLHGRYSQWTEKGKLVRRCSYRAGQLHGTDYRYEDGKPVYVADFNNGKLHGTEKIYKAGKLVSQKVWHAGGILLFDRTKKQVTATLQHIERVAIQGPGTRQQQDAVRRLMMYRYVCGVPWEGITLDAQMNLEALRAAQICEKLKRLTHNPESNPGMSEKDFALGKRGAGKSNLAMGSKGLTGSVDMWMNDSDSSNIDRVGHRRWSLNPALLKIGYGITGRYSAQWTMDRSRTEIPAWDVVAFPTRGFTPSSMFKARYAWSVSLNPKRYAKPEKGSVKVRVWAVGRGGLDLEQVKSRKSLKLDYFTVETSGFGVRNAIIFRPEAALVAPGMRYWVQIEGIKRTGGDGGENSDRLEYLVEFM